MSEPQVAIIGAGPTGIGAAWRLQELEHSNWRLYEAASTAGGLASSFVDDRGFTWDLGGHIIFSHYKYFDALIAAALRDQWVEHVREAWVWIRERWIPYPFQNNIWRLPEQDLIACLNGLIDLASAGNGSRAERRTFEDWLLASFGTGLCETFMFPYNFKVWAYPPRELDVVWMGERVATVDLRRVVRNLVLKYDDAGWGPNATFRFPLHGGTGSIWQSLSDQLPSDRQHFGRRVVRVNTADHRLFFSDGSTEGYDHLISTIPLDVLLNMIEDAPDITPLASQFVHSSTHVVGIGMEGSPPAELRTKCWMYFSEPETPFYRATVFSNYSPNNVARPGEQWSLMAEISESSQKPVNANEIVEQAIAGFRHCGMIREDEEIVSRWHSRLEHGYPTPWLGRDAVLQQVHSTLEARDIMSRGRFGAWKYEVSNQDHSVMQGVEAVGRILQGTPEYTFNGDMKDWIAPPAARAGHAKG